MQLSNYECIITLYQCVCGYLKVHHTFRWIETDCCFWKVSHLQQKFPAAIHFQSVRFDRTFSGLNLLNTDSYNGNFDSIYNLIISHQLRSLEVHYCHEKSHMRCPDCFQ
jgi:hypothetical protein